MTWEEKLQNFRSLPPKERQRYLEILGVSRRLGRERENKYFNFPTLSESKRWRERVREIDRMLKG